MTRYELTEKELVRQINNALLNIKPRQISATLTLLNDAATVPFIARYRKEMTGNLDEVQLRQIQVTSKKIQELSERKNTVLRAIDEQDKLTPVLSKSIIDAENIREVDDIYLPYKQKRRTKAMIARENGLQPLADWLLNHLGTSVNERLHAYFNETIKRDADATAGIHEILAEQFGEDQSYRQWLRTRMMRDGHVLSTLKRGGEAKDDTKIYEQYYDFDESIQSLKENKFRILAIDRGEKVGVLSVKIDFPAARLLHFMKIKIIGHQQIEKENGELINFAIEDAYKRFIQPAIEREIRQELTQIAQQQAIQVFGNNLYHLLMQAPLKNKIVMGFDPGFRTGSKLAIIDGNGNFLVKQVIFPHLPASKHERDQAATTFKKLLKDFNVELVAIGNGTASRESEEFVAENLIKGVRYTIVNEAGASVYSASEAARAEFPDLHVEERSAISIARRVQDPLAELIKIDPKSVGVGQYQHDLNAKALDEQVDAVVETAVNQVGVNLNTASAKLLTHIAGLNQKLAENIVAYRQNRRPFTLRTQLKDVPRLGPKAYEQAAGFLRIVDGKNILDNTDIHPESYHIATQIIDMGQLSVHELSSSTADKTLSLLDNSDTAAKLGVGVQTLHDIIISLQKPGRDGRSEMVSALLKSDVLHIADLKSGMKLQGTVRNVVDFGAFVDLGVKQDGLVHISHLSKRRIKHPAEVVSVGDIVDVWVLSVDEKRQRIALTMLAPK